MDNYLIEASHFMYDDTYLIEKKVTVAGKEFNSSKEAGMYLASIGKTYEDIMKILNIGAPMAKWYVSQHKKSGKTPSTEKPVTKKTVTKKAEKPVTKKAEKPITKKTAGTVNLTKEERLEKIREAINKYEKASSRASMLWDQMSSNYYGSMFDDNGGPITQSKEAIWRKDPEYVAATERAKKLQAKAHEVAKSLGAEWRPLFDTIKWTVDPKTFGTERTTKTPEELKKEKFDTKTIDYINNNVIKEILANKEFVYPDRIGSFTDRDGDGYKKDINGIFIAANPNNGYVAFIDKKTKKVRLKKFSQRFAKGMADHYNAKKDDGNHAHKVISGANHFMVTDSKESIKLDDPKIKQVFGSKELELVKKLKEQLDDINDQLDKIDREYRAAKKKGEKAKASKLSAQMDKLQDENDAVFEKFKAAKKAAGIKEPKR